MYPQKGMDKAHASSPRFPKLRLLINSTFSDVSLIMSGPSISLSVDSHQQVGDQYGLPYKASTGAMPMVAW